jgi:DNA polymerase-3 subunit alpha
MREFKMAQAIEECKRMEISVLQPDINKSKFSFSIEENQIRFGLCAIKNVGGAAIDSILAAREAGSFTSFTDFLNRVELRKVNKKTIESLIKAGAFTEFGNRATLLKNYPIVVKDVSDKKTEVEKGQFGLFSSDDTHKHKTDNFMEIDEFSEDELFQMEKEVIGFLISRNPLSKYQSLLEKKVTKKIGEITAEDNGKVHIIAGVVSGKKIIKTKKDNHEMAFLNFFDESGTIEVVVFPKTFAAYKNMIAMNKILLMKGKISDRDGTMSIMMEKAVDLEKVVMNNS